MSESTATSAAAGGTLSETEARSLRALYPVMERVRPRLDAAIDVVAAQIPTFAVLLRGMDESTRRTQTAAARELERAAMLEGEWEPYAAYLRELATVYAHAGVEFEGWHALLRPYRDVIEAEILPASLESERAVLTGMNIFLDRSMATLARAYIEEKEQIVRRTAVRLGLYERMFRDSPIGKLIYEWDAPPDPSTLRLVAANSQAVAMSGGRVVDLLERTIEDPDDPEREALLDRLVSVLEHGETERWTVRRASGESERIYDCQCFAMSARTAGLLVQDVTEQRRTEEALARHARDLERSNRELDDFAYVASHDLKAPLRDIDSLASWIEEDAAEHLPAESKRHLAKIRDRIGRMERLLDDLLQYSRAGRIFHQPEPFELRRVVDDVLAVTPPPPSFDVVVSGDAPPVRAPRVPFELVLRNLVSNAVKHHQGAAGRIEIEIATHPEHVELSVTDDGPGIPAELHERVFRMFQTLRPRDEVEGSGMGLAVVKKVVEAHGGRVMLQSAPGHGTTVRFTWPREWKRS